MITFFTSLKPFRGTTAIQQGNALRNWRRIIPESEIIVFGAVEGGEDVIAEIEATYRPDIACNEFGTPLISAMFAEAQRIGRHSMLCYINGDILLLPDFAVAIARLAKWKTFVAVGQCWDLDCAAPIDFTAASWSGNLRATVLTHGRQRGAAAMDMFTFRRGAIGALPAFAIGRPAWDNYLIKQLLRSRIPIVDLSRVIVPIHQKHDYAHVAQRRNNSWEGPEGDRNRKLADAAFSRFNPQYYTIDVAQWIMLDRVTVPAVSFRRLWWRFLAVVPDHVRYAALIGLSLFRRSGPVPAWLARLADLYITTLPFRMLPRRANKIAVIRLDNIGDFILWLDGARAIRTRYPPPDCRVSLIASSKWSEYAELSGLFDEVIAVDAERFFGETRYRRVTCYQIAKRRFGTAINPTFSRNTRIDDFLVKASGASVRIGQVGDLSNATIGMKRITDRWYTELVPSSEHATHELVRNFHFAKRFDPNIVLRGPKLQPTMIKRLRWLPDDNDYFVLFAGARWPIRLWPAERFGDIAVRIHAKTGWAGIVCGSPSESGAAQRLIAHAKSVPILNACGKTTLPELAGVIAEARLTVTNETSAVHLAAALRVPAVAILGGGHFGRFLPYPAKCESVNQNLRIAYHSMPCYQCNWCCVYTRQPDEPGPCVTSVSVDDVWALLEPFLCSRPDVSEMEPEKTLPTARD